ncbi:hypothetical protein G3T36_18820 [Diaminobutyricibacter tongyongensis]|uniref:Fibronectin type-III domain-containing protein n=1 Tax=Leifsonia tongyongensis TaxID=1268043 RepID=A0A6L9Y402_9MICO|nr:hypothetical protein [Diaminobutyricibacter tongyongensis]NEN07914.1 hypothetical protein [Diaminobutyricibacter tongyongensis]
MSRLFSRVLLTAGLIALGIGGVTSAGALPAQADPNSDTSVDGLLATSRSVSVAEGSEAKEMECAAPLENFEVYDLTETGFKLRWTLPDNHPEYTNYILDGLGAYVLPVGDFPFTEAIGLDIKPGTHYAVGVSYICSDGSMAGTPMLRFVTPGVAPAPEFDFGPEAAATMNSSSGAGSEAAANATGNSSGSAPVEGSENVTTNAAAESSAGSGAIAAAEATLDESTRNNAAQVQTKALANTGQAAGGLELVGVGLISTGLIALLARLAYQFRQRRA